MKKIAVIANRTAGRGRAIVAIQEAKRTLWGWPLEFICPESPDHLQRVCRDLDPEVYEAAVVIGGDGTMNQALRGMANGQVPLFAYPGGTANDFAGELGMTGHWEQVQRLLDKRIIEPIDLITANGIPFATVAGIGVGSILTAELNEQRQKSVLFREGLKRLRSELYTVLSAKTVLFRRDYLYHLHIRSNVFDEKIKTAAVFVCNQNKLAGNLRVAQFSEHNDQMFSVLIIPGHRIDELIGSLLKLKFGKLAKGDFISFSTQSLTIRDLQGRPFAVFGDGETLIEDTAVEFKIRPKGIQVYKERRKNGTRIGKP